MPGQHVASCIYVANKPYLKVYGGDVTAGSGLETAPDTCTNNTDAAIVAWNRNSSGGYAGAGAQYAAFALRAITDFATAQGNAAGAPAPSGLAFANTATNVALGNFGGTFGSVTCIADYYARKPSTTAAMPIDVSAMVTNAYGATGAVSLTGGTVNRGERISVYVDGDVFINSNITYADDWSYDNVPLFQLVVKGNIYISSTVTQLDGLYVAQQDGGAGGVMYTCATAMAPPALTGTFFNTCNSRLTVNGAFVANSVEFLRTRGTLSQSLANEDSTASSAGEVFNFNPSLWMVQPLDDSGRVDQYDAITSLPPVL